LAQAFLEAHPAEAAGVLEGLPPGDVAELSRTVPPEAMAPALGAMAPALGGRCLQELAEEDAADLLEILPTRQAAALLRSLPQYRQRLLLGRIKTGRRTALASLLHQPGDTVGAWTDPDILTAREDAPVGRALQEVQESGHRGACGLYVVDGDFRLVGVVQIPELLQAGRETPVGRLADRSVPALPAATGLAALPGHPAWKHLPELPVADARGRLLGAVTAATLALAVQGPRAAVPEQSGTMLNELGSSFFQALGMLVQTLVGGRGQADRRDADGR